MKYFVKAQIAWNQLKSKKGQGTVEYLMMLLVIVVVIIAVGGLMQKFMPELFEKIKEKVFGGVSSM